MAEQEERIRVAIRIRPLAAPSNNDDGSSRKEAVAVLPEHPDTVCVYTDADRQRAATFRCDTFLPSSASQPDVFDQLRIKELVEAALDGFPVTIFAYGQTGAGKSFTIFGKEEASGSSGEAAARKKKPTGDVQPTDGLMPRTAAYLMDVIDARHHEVEYTLRVTCVEIYNEQVRDVFDPHKEALAVRSSKQHGFFLENATVVECATTKEIVKVVKAAASNRARSSHLLNDCSNRSHCLVTIYIDALPINEGNNGGQGAAPARGKTYGKLTIVDLAGSERATDTGAAGVQLRETGHINKSLYCLNQVIQAMNSKAKGKFVPYRDSKLTMLLLDSLGGNSKTLMVACVNAAPQFVSESVRTLEFAMGVAKIKNRPAAVLNPHEKLIRDLREQIRLLKLENMMLRARTPGYFLEHPDQYNPDALPLETSRSTGRGDGDPTEQRADIPEFEAFSPERRPDPMKQQQQDFSDQHTLFVRRALPLEAGAKASSKLRPEPRAATTEEVTRSSDLKLLKSKQLRRPLEKTQRTKTHRVIKPTSKKKKKQVAVPPLLDFSSLPPMFPKLPVALDPRSFLKSPPMVDPIVARAATPPPGYDDLFGIEMVSVAPTLPGSRSSASIKLDALPQPTTSGRSHAILSRGSTSDSASARPELSPEDQLQQLLAQIAGPMQYPQAIKKAPAQVHRPPVRSDKAAPPMRTKRPTHDLQPPPSPPPAAASKSLQPSNPAQWDDDRARDLFLQLCRL